MTPEGRPIRVLFLCTANSCRSQMAEALLRHLGGQRFEALSAGSHPSGFIHPLATDALMRLGVPVAGQTSKSWDDFVGQPIDAVITVCDAAAAQACPVFPGNPMQVPWFLPDPVYYPGTDEERLAFTLSVAERLRTKIEGLVQQDWSAPRPEVKKRLEFLGEI
jgi:arsenate reductase